MSFLLLLSVNRKHMTTIKMEGQLHKQQNITHLLSSLNIDSVKVLGHITVKSLKLQTLS